MDQVECLRDLPVRDFETLIAWECRALVDGRANGDSSGNDLSRSSQGVSGTPMPYVGETGRQREQEETSNAQQELLNNAISCGKSELQVDMKFKRDENEGFEDVKWEEVPPAGGTYKVDLNVEADDVSGNQEDDIEWEKD